MSVFQKECSVITLHPLTYFHSYAPCTAFFSTTSMCIHLVVAAVTYNTCLSMHLLSGCRTTCYITVLDESSHMPMQLNHCFLCFLGKSALYLSLSLCCDNALLLQIRQSFILFVIFVCILHGTDD
jgi:hypothetical protein